ncbi:MAG: pimeloyl-ACP methyl ester esterase BioH [Pseudomonadota bacterium]
MHIETAGQGPDLVLLHGWGMHGGVWDGVCDALARKFRVHVVDLPGYGGSTACHPYTLGELALSIAASMPQRVTVCGWSLGGQVALRWALDAPRQVARLILVATTPCFVKLADWDCGMDAAVFDEFAEGVHNNGAAALSRFMSLQAQGDAAARSVAATLRDGLKARALPDADVLHAGLRVLRDTDLRGEAERITQPAVVVHGECDALVPCAAGRWLVQHMPQAKLHVMTGAAHAPFLSDPEAFVRVLADDRFDE